MAQTRAPERVTVSGLSRAVISTRLSLLKVDDIDFGEIAPGTTAGTVVLSPDNTRTRNGGVLVVTGHSKPGLFAGYGSRNQLVTISMNANSILLRRSGGPQTMRVDTFMIGSTPNTPLTTAPRTFRIAAPTGLFEFTLGATLRVGANQAPGIYTGNFAITINYQ